MTDWTIFARDEYVAAARDFDVFWDGEALLLEGTPAGPPGDLESLDDVFDARFAHLDETASQMAESAGWASPALRADALALRYELVRLLRIAAFFTIARPIDADSLLTFYHDPRRDADYAALLASLTDAVGAALRLGPGAADRHAPAARKAARATRSLTRRFDAGGERPKPKSSFWRGGAAEVARWRLWASRVNAALDAGWNALVGERRAPVVLVGRPEILDPVCGELLARGERVVWLWEHFHAGVFARWRAAGVRLVALDAIRDPSAPRSGATSAERKPPAGEADQAGGRRSDASGDRRDDGLGDLSHAGLTFYDRRGRPIDFVPAIRAWAATRRDAAVRHAVQRSRVERVFAKRPPKALVVDEDATPFKRIAIEAARATGAKSFVLQHGAPGVRFGFAPLSADLHLAWGEVSKRRLTEWGVAEETIEVVGCPRRDRWRDIVRGDRSRSSVQESHDPCRTVLVLASPAPRDERPDALAFPLTTAAYREMWRIVFETLAARSGIRAVVKLHPRDSNRETLARWAAEAGATRIDWRATGDASDLFAEADAAIGLASSAGLEAAAWGVPVVSLLPPRAADLYPAGDWGLVAEVRTREGLAAALDAALARPPLGREEREAIWARAWNGLDGSAARRAVQAIVRHASAGRSATAA